MRDRWIPGMWRAFELGFRPWMRRRLHPVLVTGLPRSLPHDRPVVLCPNHVSWWDGFLTRAVQRELRPDAPLLTVMLASELARQPVLRLLGGVGLTPGSSASLRALLRRLSAARSERPDLVTVLFPQGRLRPATVRPLDFQPGIRGVARALAPVTVLPVGLQLAFGREPRAAAYVSVGRPLTVDGDPPPELARLVERRVEDELDALASHLEHHGADAPRAWPGPLGRLHRPLRPAGPVPPPSTLTSWPDPRTLWPGSN